MFEKPRKVGRPSLNPRMVSLCGWWLPEPVGVTYRLVTAIGTAFTSKSSRGGKNTKIHVLLNERMQVLSAGHIHDSEQTIDRLKSIALKGKKILADCVINFV